MKNNKTNYRCSNCDYGSTLHLYRCPRCQQFDTFSIPKESPKQFKNQVELFNYVWNNRPHVSEISGKPLGDEMVVNYFMHVLNKGLYPKFKLREDCIMLGTVREHTLLDVGTKDERNQYEMEEGCSFDVFYLKQAELKKEDK